MKSWNKNTVLHILKIVLAIGLIYWLVHRGTLDLQAMKVIFTPVYLVSCFGLMLVMMLLGHLRWFFLLRSRSFAVSFWHTLPLTFIGLFFNFTMPGSVGGDFVKGYYVTRDHPQRKMEAAVTVMMDRIVGLFAMMVMAVVAIVFSWRKISLQPDLVKLSWLLLIILGFTGSFFLFFLFSGWAVRVLERMHGFSKFGMSFLLRMAQSLHLYRNSKAVLGYTFLISILSQLIAVCFFIVVGYALGEHLSFLAFLFSVSLGYIATALPISPGGLGVGQLAFYSFFKTYTGQELQVGVIGITANQTIMFSLGLIGALFYLQRGYKHREKLSI